MMKKNILLLIILLIGILYHAQNLTNVMVDKGITPSASVAALGKYGDRSGIDNKGKYNTSIDILNLKTGNLKYDLGISYSSNGLKLNDWGGRIGLLWSDNFTSSIYRTVRGLPDEFSQKVGNLPIADYSQYLSTLEQMSTAVENNYTAGIDGESDIYDYNIFGLSGSFIIVNGEVLQINYTEKLKIEYSSNLSSFTITLKNGNKYYYGVNNNIEYTTYDTVCSEEYAPPPKQKTAWFLTRMENTDASSFINFTYANAYANYTEDKSQTLTIKNKKYPGDQVANYYGNEWNYMFTNSECTRTKVSDTKYLTTVTSPDFILNFSYFNRKDNPSEWLLNKIDLTANNNVLVNTIKFDYFKYGDNLTETLYGNTIRYFLRKLTIGKAEDKNYYFTYENPAALPTRFVYSQDLNGVYNGYSNTSLLPAEYVVKMLHLFAVVNPQTEYSIPPIQTGIRTSHFPESSYGMLNNIKYPTGGQEKIFYEPNTVIKDTTNNIETEYYGVRTKKVELWSTDNEKITKQYLYNKTHFDSLSNKVIFDSHVSSIYPEELDDYGGHLSATYNSGAITFIGYHYKYYKINSNKLTGLGVFQGDPIAYTDVTEKIDNRFTVTKYFVVQDVFTQPILGELNSYSQNTHYFWYANNILSRYNGELKNGNYNVKKISNWSFTFKDYKFTENYIPARDYEPYNVPQGDKIFAYSLGRYVIPNRWYNNYKESETIILENGSKIKTDITNSYFDINNFNNLKTNTTSYSDGNTNKVEYQYAKDLYTTGDLIQKNMVGIPIITTNYHNNVPISKSKISFSKYWLGHDKLLPLQQDSVPLDIINTPNESYQTEVRYDHYDAKGNLLQYTTKEGIPVTIIYGYNQTLPILKVEGISYIGLMDVLGMDDNIVNYNNLPICQISNTEHDSASEELLINALDSIRQSPYLTTTKVTTYTYDPLVGVTSITSPSGIREKYVYDSLSNRLKEVKVLEKAPNGVYVYKTTKEYKYNYKN